MSQQVSRQALTDTATTVRSFLEPIWAEWHDAWNSERPHPLSRWTCARTSLFVLQVLRHQGISAVWRSGAPLWLADGSKAGAVGFRRGGSWESHAWVEAGGFILDITADQFGDAPVIVVPVGDDRYAAGEGAMALSVDAEERVRAVAAIWPRWLERHEAHRTG